MIADPLVEIFFDGFRDSEGEIRPIFGSFGGSTSPPGPTRAVLNPA